MPWTRHLRGCRDMLRRAFEAANRIGDLTYAAYCGNQLNTNLLAAGDPLAGAQREAEHGLAFAQKARFGQSIDTIATQLGLIRTLRGLTPTFGSFDDEQFDEARIERRFSENPDLAVAEWRYWVRKLQARFFAGDYASAIEASSRAQRLLWTSISQFETAEYHFYGALARAASCDSAATSEREQHLDIVAAHHKQLQLWAANCPENFEDRAALVGAEIARIEGRALDAMDLYEQAIRSAQANSFVHNEALANELAARVLRGAWFRDHRRRLSPECSVLLSALGAEGKVRQLERLHPQLCRRAGAAASHDHNGGAAGAARPRHRRQDVPNIVGRNCAGQVDRDAHGNSRSSTRAPSAACWFLSRGPSSGSKRKLRPAATKSWCASSTRRRRPQSFPTRCSSTSRGRKRA